MTPVAAGHLTTPAPVLTAEREPVNGWFHLGGAVLAAGGLVVLGAASAERGSIRHAVAAGIFGGSALLMFASSALYHLARRSRRSALYRRLDHAMIYLFIAGTFTPVCLIALRGTALGVPLLASVWGLAALGVVQEVGRRGAPRGLATALYLGLGWLGALTVPALLHTAPVALLGWLVAGGLLYTAGALVYWARWPRGVPGVFGFHELWHVFVLAASASHYWAILAYVLPLR